MGVSVDPLPATALLQSELFISFDLLSDLDRRVISEWDLLNSKEKDGIPVPAVFAIGPGRKVLARSVDSMTRQIGPEAFLSLIDSDSQIPPRRRWVIPRFFESLRLSRRISKANQDR